MPGCRGAWRRSWGDRPLLFTSPLFFLFLAMAWNDHWLVLFGTLAGACLVRFLTSYEAGEPGQGHWLYATGLCLGLAGLCKYLALFLGLGCLGAIAMHLSWRRLFWDGRLYGAIAIAVAMTAPIFIWNIQHDFYSFQFYLGRSVQAERVSLQWFGPIGFLLLSGLIVGPMQVWAMVKAAQAPLKTPFAVAYRRVAIAVALMSTVSLALLSLKAPVLYYWNILAYPLLFPLMAGIFLSPAAPRLRHDPGLRLAEGLGLVVAAVLVCHYTLVPLSALISPQGDEDTRMLYGWKQVAQAIATQADTFATPPLLLTTDYRSAAALAYERNDPTVMAISGRIDQFDFWYDAATLAGRDALLLGDNWHPICPAHRALFDRTDAPQQIVVRRFGVFIKEYTLLRGYGFHSGVDDQAPLSADYPLAFTTDGEVCTPQGYPTP
jgi:hypothetical protein